MMIATAASGGVSMPVSMNGRSKPSSTSATPVRIRKPPSTTPRMMEATVRPSIQPLAATSFECGRYSVRMPYLAGE